jgi:hypothetical protein
VFGGQTESHDVAQADLKLGIFQPLLSQCWGYRHTHHTQHIFGFLKKKSVPPHTHACVHLLHLPEELIKLYLEFLKAQFGHLDI